MGMTYFKRYRMEYDLEGEIFARPELPPGYWSLVWSERLLESHAQVKFESFRFELDANVFPCLGDAEGCLRLLKDIISRPGFSPEATWLVGCQVPGQRRFEYCGTIQGIIDDRGIGTIQNLGITPAHRCKGLGRYLLWQALDGFRHRGVRRASLEVTAHNTRALDLYQRLGFRVTKTVYKAVDVAYA